MANGTAALALLPLAPARLPKDAPAVAPASARDAAPEKTGIEQLIGNATADAVLRSVRRWWIFKLWASCHPSLGRRAARSSAG